MVNKSMRPLPLFRSLLLAGLISPPAIFSQVNVLTQHNDNTRSGANLNETVLTPANVTAAQFGLLTKYAVDDQVYTQPLVAADMVMGGAVHNVVYVATVNNTVYAFDADDFTRTAPYWQVNLGTAPNRNTNGGAWTCGNING